MILHLCVILFMGGGGLCPIVHHRSHDRWVSVQGGLCLGGSFSRGLCSGGSLSKGGLCPGGFPVRETPCMVMRGRYTSYWNAFLLLQIITSVKNISKNYE